MQFRNWFASVFVCSFVYFCNGEECINADEDGTCLERCPENTFAYVTGCENVTISQRTCRHPVVRTLGYICDYTRCDCHEPQLWDEAARKCVRLDQCSDQSAVVEQEENLKKQLENITYRPYVDPEYDYTV